MHFHACQCSDAALVIAKNNCPQSGRKPEMLTAEQIRELLQMRPHPIEGGYFAETYRGAAMIPQSLPGGYPGHRAISTAIYYLLTPDTFSAMHRVRGDELFHFYLGDAVEMLQLKKDGTGEVIVLVRISRRGCACSTRCLEACGRVHAYVPAENSRCW